MVNVYVVPGVRECMVILVDVVTSDVMSDDPNTLYRM